MLRRLLNFLSPAVWIVRCDGGQVTVVKGTVPPLFLSDCRGILGSAGIQAGRISGKQERGYVTLEFGSEIPKGLHQRFRNLWADHDQR